MISTIEMTPVALLATPGIVLLLVLVVFWLILKTRPNEPIGEVAAAVADIVHSMRQKPRRRR